MSRRALALVSCLCFVAGCGSDDDAKGSSSGPTDLRVAIPAADPSAVDLVTPEFTIAAGEEKMFCIYLDNDQGEFAVSKMESNQGKFGHHMVMLTTVEPKAHGTIEDCTEASEMWKFRSFILPDTPLPDGFGIKVPAGMQYVLQLHYVNASAKPILVRDVARLKKIPVESVTTWTTTLTTNSLNIDLPGAGTVTESFDCAIPEEVDLLVVGGHMHETGSTMEILMGPSTDALDSVYYVDPWVPEYRDAPPVTLMFQAPRKLTQGTVVRTTCTWKNPTTKAITFPEEMCAGFGYIAGTDQPFHCEPAAK